MSHTHIQWWHLCERNVTRSHSYLPHGKVELHCSLWQLSPKRQKWFEEKRIRGSCRHILLFTPAFQSVNLTVDKLCVLGVCLSSLVIFLKQMDHSIKKAFDCVFDFDS